MIRKLLNNIFFRTSNPIFVIDVEDLSILYFDEQIKKIFQIESDLTKLPSLTHLIVKPTENNIFHNNFSSLEISVEINNILIDSICDFEIIDIEDKIGLLSISSYKFQNQIDINKESSDFDIDKFYQRLKESEERYRSLFDGSSEGIIVIDAEDKKINFSNSTFLDIFGFKEKDLIDRSFSDLFPEYAADYISLQISNDHKNKYIPSVPYLMADNTIGYANISFAAINFENSKSIMCLFTDITDQLQKEKALLRFNNAFKMSTDAIILTDNTGHICDLNFAACQLFNLTSIDHVLEKKVSEIIPGVNKSELGKLIGGSLKSTSHNFFEWNVVDETGNINPIELSISSMSDNENNIGFMIIGRDISERKKYESELEKSLQEKELLLKEIHHRVKNNLQVISSILSLQSRYVKDQDVIDMLEESQNRVKSMSIIHESLCNAEDIAHIDMDQYIDKLNSYMQHSYPQFNTKIIKNSQSDNSTLDLQKATSCGIIINELVSNSLKYAFNEEDESIITVNFTRKNNNCVLSIKDNGRGLPDDLDFEHTKSFGLRLVRILTNQLNGTVTIVNKNGTEFMIQFPAN